MISSLQKQLLNDFQQDFPLSPTPYLDIAQSIGVSEEEVLRAFNELEKHNFISRIGPVIQPNHIGPIGSIMRWLVLLVTHLLNPAENPN
jgi:DNA-binding Lrp family transcriptional regulator